MSKSRVNGCSDALVERYLGQPDFGAVRPGAEWNDKTEQLLTVSCS